MARKSSSSDAALLELRVFGLAYPGVTVKSPWPGHHDLAVKDKTFAYMSLEGEPFRIGCKLPQSSTVALMLPWTKPMEYGLGKSGWVSAKPPEGREIPVEMFKEWMDESYRAQAPKTLLKQLLTAPSNGAATRPVATRPAARSTAKKAAAKKPTAKKPTARTAAKKSAIKKPAAPAKKSAAKKR
ncbi:MAG: DifB protein [Myxococcales bacterium]|nr:DifB protein [Myxococcales bacterium]